MSKPLDEVYVEIKARTDKLDKAFNKLKKDFKTTQQNAKKTSSIFQSSFAKMAAGALSLTAIFNGLRSSINSAFTQKLAEAKIERALKTTGEAAGFAAGEIKSMAQELQRMTGIGDEKSLNDIFAQLLTFTNIKGDAFIRASKAAADLAEVIGTDLRSQTIQLGKALEDPIKGIGALSRVGITFTETQKDTIKGFIAQNDLLSAQGVILTEIETKYGGQAKAAADAQGGLKQLRAEMGDMAEDIGQSLIPSFVALSKSFLDFLRLFTESAIDKAIRRLQDLGLEAGKLNKLISARDKLNALNEIARLTKVASGDANDFVSRWNRLTNIFVGDEKLIKRIHSQMSFFEDSTVSLTDKQNRFNVLIEQLTNQYSRLVEAKTKGEDTEAVEDLISMYEFLIKKITPRIEAQEKIKQLQEAITGKTEETTEAVDELTNAFKLAPIEVLKLNVLLSKTKLKATVFDEAFKALDKLKEEREKLEQTGTLTNVDTKTSKEPVGGIIDVSEKPLLEFNETALTTDAILNTLTDSANRAGDAMARSLTDAIFKGENLISVLGETLKMFAQIAAQQLITSAIGAVTGGGLLGLIGGLFSSAAPDGGGGGNGLQAVTSAVNQVNGSIQNLTLQSLRQGTRPQVNNIYMDSKLVSNAIKSADNTFQGNSVDRTQI